MRCTARAKYMSSTYPFLKGTLATIQRMTRTLRRDRPPLPTRTSAGMPRTQGAPMLSYRRKWSTRHGDMEQSTESV